MININQLNIRVLLKDLSFDEKSTTTLVTMNPSELTVVGRSE